MELSRREALVGAAVIAAVPLLQPVAANAEGPATLHQAASFYRYKVGDILVTVVSDGAATFPIPDNFVTNASKVQINTALEKAFRPKDKVTIAFGPLVLNTGGKVVVIHSGVDHLFFRPPDVKEARTPFRVCFVGRVEIAKGLPYLLEAWRKLNLRNAELVLVGEVAKEMRPFFDASALPGLRLMGLLPAREVSEWYRRSHLFVFPSVNEGLARSIMEAMASGLPVIATDLSGGDDCITTGVEGAVIPARNAEALAESISWHYENAEASMAMGDAARARIEREFTTGQYVDRVMEMYRAVAPGSAQYA